MILKERISSILHLENSKGFVLKDTKSLNIFIFFVIYFDYLDKYGKKIPLIRFLSFIKLLLQRDKQVRLLHNPLQR